MSYEAWGDDDDGLDGVREAYRQSLLEDGWLDDEQAKELIEALRSVVTHIPKYVLRKHGVVDRYSDGALVDGGTEEFPRFVDEVAKARALLVKHAPKVSTPGGAQR